MSGSIFKLRMTFLTQRVILDSHYGNGMDSRAKRNIKRFQVMILKLR